MLTKFSVSNFKGFNETFVFDLTDTNGYTFNSNSVKNGIVKNALIYGHNGVGKSNLGLAIFDIVSHLTDLNTDILLYSSYLNASNKSKVATFKYEFLINNSVVIYEYKKENFSTMKFEKFSIDNVELAFINQEKNNTANIKLKGAESLKKEINNDSLSLLKYIRYNSELEKNNENKTFLDFYGFIQKMLFFRSLKANMFIGLENQSRDIIDDIIRRGNVPALEKFFHEAGIDCKLIIIQEFNKNTLAFNFKDKTIPFYQIASQGTKALILFYFWLQRIKEEGTVSLLFIDEFDAFYHHELSALIVEELKNTNVQFILTTHNTSIITNDLLRPDCYFLMKKDSIKSLAKSTSKELREAHNIEKMYKAYAFNE